MLRRHGGSKHPDLTLDRRGTAFSLSLAGTMLHFFANAVRGGFLLLLDRQETIREQVSSCVQSLLCVSRNESSAFTDVICQWDESHQLIFFNVKPTLNS